MLLAPRSTAAQEIVAHPGSARLPAEGAEKEGGEWIGGTGSRSRAYRHGARARSPGATLLRHFLPCRQALPVGGLTLGMSMAPAPTLLIPTPRLPPTPQPSRPAAVPRAVALAPIALRADVDHSLAQIAEKASTVGSKSRHATDMAWTPPPKPAILIAAGAVSPRPSAGDGCLAQTVCRPPRPFSPILPRLSATLHTPRPRATMMLTHPTEKRGSQPILRPF